jgi:hypothetical protein
MGNDNDNVQAGLTLVSKEPQKPCEFSKELIMKQLVVLPMGKNRKNGPQKKKLISSLRLVLD